MLRRAALIVACAALAPLTSACTWQQAYASAQGWQRNACYRLPDETERERCLRGTGLSYDDYRRQRDRTARD